MDLQSVKTSLTSPIPPITATSSSLMMSPPSEPELTPKTTTKNFQLSPDQASLQAEGNQTHEPEVPKQTVNSHEDDDDSLIIDVTTDQTEPENLVKRESPAGDHSPESNATEISIPNTESSNLDWSGGCEMLQMLAAAAEMRANLDRISDGSTIETSPESLSTATSSNSSPSSSTPTSGHSMISAISAASAIASSVCATRTRAPMKRSLEYPAER